MTGRFNFVVAIAFLAVTLGCGKEESGTANQPKSKTGDSGTIAASPPFDEKSAEKAVEEIRARTRNLSEADLTACARLLDSIDWLKGAEKAASTARRFHEVVLKRGGSSADGLLQDPPASAPMTKFDIMPPVDVDRVFETVKAALSGADETLDGTVSAWGKVQKALTDYLELSEKVEKAIQNKLAAVAVVSKGQETARKLREGRSGSTGTNLSGLYQGGVGGRGGWPTDQYLDWTEQAAKSEKDQGVLDFLQQLRKALANVQAAASEGRALVGALRRVVESDSGMTKNWNPHDLRACKDALDGLGSKFFHFDNWGADQIDPSWQTSILSRRESSLKAVEAVAGAKTQVSQLKDETARYRSQIEDQIGRMRAAALAWGKVREGTKDFASKVDENRYLTASPPAEPVLPGSQGESVHKSAKSYRIEGEHFLCNDGKKSLLFKVPARYSSVFVKNRSQKEPNEARVAGQFIFKGNSQGTNLLGAPVTVEVWAADDAWATAMLSHAKAMEEYERKKQDFERLRTSLSQRWYGAHSKVIDSCRTMLPPASEEALRNYLESVKTVREASQ